MLQRYRSARLAWLDSADSTERDRLTVAFFEATDLDGALKRAAELLDPSSARSLAAAMRHFTPRYQRIWRNGQVPHDFLDRVRGSERREELARLLAGVAGFFGGVADTGATPAARAGTGAPRIRNARPGDRPLLADRDFAQARAWVTRSGRSSTKTPICLISRISQARLEALGRTALGEKPWGLDAWDALREALPTAIAQGVAHQSFRRGTWSIENDWYDVQRIDEYAKRIFPLVKEALAGDGTFDEKFVKQLVQAYR